MGKAYIDISSKVLLELITGKSKILHLLQSEGEIKTFSIDSIRQQLTADSIRILFSSSEIRDDGEGAAYCGVKTNKRS